MARRKELRVRGRLLDAEDGRPLARYRIRLLAVDESADPTPIGSAKSSGSGEFEIRFYRRSSVAEILDKPPDEGPGFALAISPPRGDPIHVTHTRDGEERFEDWVVEVEIPRSEAQWLNEKFSVELERFLKQPQVLKKISQMLAEETDVSAERIYEELVDADPFGISPFTWRTTVCCILNNLMDQFKQTQLASATLFGGNTYKHLWFVPRQRGFVRGFQNTTDGFVRPPVVMTIEDGVEGRTEIDEDFNFSIAATQPSLMSHWRDARRSGRLGSELFDQFTPGAITNNLLWCEIVPCDQVGAMRRFMSELKARKRQAAADRAAGRTPSPIWVEISGTLTWDGTHDGYPGHLEIHPVTWGRVL